jgi:hypothetical protein
MDTPGRIDELLCNNCIMDVTRNDDSFVRSTYEPLDTLLLNFQRGNVENPTAVYKHFSSQVREVKYDDFDILDAELVRAIRITETVHEIQVLIFQKRSSKIFYKSNDNKLLKILQILYEVFHYDVIRTDGRIDISLKQLA